MMGVSQLIASLKIPC